jgi:hypothetical protein
MSENEYKQYWAAQVFRGEARAEPTVLFSNGMQKEAVAAFPGAIVLMTVQDVKPGMKVVKIDGHLSGEPEYLSTENSNSYGRKSPFEAAYGDDVLQVVANSIASASVAVNVQ